MKGMSLRGSGNIVPTPDDPVPSGTGQTLDWLVLLAAIMMFCLVLSCLAAGASGNL